MKVLPDLYVEDIFSIDYTHLYKNGVRGLIFDIDNTLVPHGHDIQPDIILLFTKLHAIGFKTLLLSNNSKERVEKFNREINTKIIWDADKPAVNAFKKALLMLGMNQEEVIMIGDTLFTDIWGANRIGLKSIMVKYIGFYNKEKKGIKRKLEAFIMLFYPLTMRSGILQNRI